MSSATRPSTTASPAAPAGSATDGRNTRWNEHRTRRRRELVQATLRAIRKHGAGVGMEDIALIAGTSKTVIYRHFTDRTGLSIAVAEHVNARILRDIAAAAGPITDLTQARDDKLGRELLAAAIDAYLALVETDPEVYRFIVSGPGTAAPDRSTTSELATQVSQSIAREIAAVIEAALSSGGKSTAAATTWGYAVVGMVQAAADEWLQRGGAASGTEREALNAYLTDLIWGGLSSAWPDTTASAVAKDTP